MSKRSKGKYEEQVNIEHDKKPEMPNVNKRASRRLYMLVLGGLLTAIGLAMFLSYVFTLNMVIGAPGVFMVGGGVILFYIYWKKADDAVTEFVGKPSKEQFNSLSIYPDKMIFENVHQPGGQVWKCKNDGKRYFVNIWDEERRRLVPFELPDQQYYDPRVFAERVLGLPAHRKIFTRRQDLFHKLRPIFLIVAIILVWILIVTTTGNEGETAWFPTTIPNLG